MMEIKEQKAPLLDEEKSVNNQPKSSTVKKIVKGTLFSTLAAAPWAGVGAGVSWLAKGLFTGADVPAWTDKAAGDAALYGAIAFGIAAFLVAAGYAIYKLNKDEELTVAEVFLPFSYLGTCLVEYCRTPEAEEDEDNDLANQAANHRLLEDFSNSVHR